MPSLGTTHDDTRHQETQKNKNPDTYGPKTTKQITKTKKTPGKPRGGGETTRTKIEPILYITCGKTRIGGHGLVETLKAIEETGSLRAAATKLGINYRRLWTRIRQAEKLLGKQLVTGDRRGSRLTTEAKKIVEAYEKALQKLREAGLLHGLDTGIECRE